MAPHPTAAEWDFMQKLHEIGKTPMEVHALLAAQRGKKKKQQSPHLTKVRKALKGQTYFRGLPAERVGGGSSGCDAAAGPTMAQLWPNYGPTMAQPMAQLWPNYELLDKLQIVLIKRKQISLLFLLNQP